jgi:hypothetical protein
VSNSTATEQSRGAEKFIELQERYCIVSNKICWELRLETQFRQGDKLCCQSPPLQLDQQLPAWTQEQLALPTHGLGLGCTQPTQPLPKQDHCPIAVAPLMMQQCHRYLNNRLKPAALGFVGVMP